MRAVWLMDQNDLRALLKLPATADLTTSFDILGIDSWSLIEFRASLETRFNCIFSDDEWLEITCPNDVLHLCR